MSAPHPITCICSDCELKRKISEAVGRMTSRLIPYVDPNDIGGAVESILKQYLARAIEAKGSGAFSSLHEILGAINEEVYEFTMTVHDSNFDTAVHELADIATAAIWGIASITALREREKGKKP